MLLVSVHVLTEVSVSFFARVNREIVLTRGRANRGIAVGNCMVTMSQFVTSSYSPQYALYFVAIIIF